MSHQRGDSFTVVSEALIVFHYNDSYESYNTTIWLCYVSVSYVGLLEMSKV